MVKKLSKIAAKQAASPAGLLDSQLAASVKDSAQQIWLAGMGAFAKAQAEGGKVFDALVKEGVSLQRKTQAVAEEKLGDVTGKMSSMASEVTSKAGDYATTSLIEVWIDETERRTWFLFEAGRPQDATGR